jgi:HSP20 family protein
MNVWTWRPGWDPFSELQHHMDRLLDLTVDVGRQFWQSWRPFPALNIYETATDFVLIAPLPGVQPQDLDVSMTGNVLTLKGERKRPATVPDEMFRRQERWQGKWSRTVQVPDKADASQVNATLDNGLLVVRMPKLPEAQPRQVPVRVTSSRPQAQGANGGEP